MFKENEQILQKESYIVVTVLDIRALEEDGKSVLVISPRVFYPMFSIKFYRMGGVVREVS